MKANLTKMTETMRRVLNVEVEIARERLELAEHALAEFDRLAPVINAVQKRDE